MVIVGLMVWFEEGEGGMGGRWWDGGGVGEGGGRGDCGGCSY